MLLSATGVAGHPNSYFHRASVRKWADGLGLDVDPTVSKRTQLRAVFDAARIAGQANTTLFGLRLQAHSLGFFLKQIEILHPDEPDDVARIRTEFGPTRFILLQRASKLDQAVSFLMATQTGLWHAGADGSEIERLAPPADPVYDAARIRDTIVQLEGYDRLWEDWFVREGIAPLRLDYEALSNDPHDILRQVLTTLNCDTDLTDTLSIPTMKLANATSREWTARFREENARP